MRREVLTCSTTIEEALKGLEDLRPKYEVGDLGIEEVYDENGEFEGFGVVWACEEY